ncbi:HNH endonuclease [Methylopila musalis]|uniref:HNH endonuclease n=1 Tax=Methylopila musalis TaxID=1134781 RepID=A0ABW3Z3I9_9HYPH
MPKRPPLHAKADDKARERRNDQARGSARARGYTAQWDREARAFLLLNPVCAYCDADGRTAAAKVVDHLYPQRQWPGAFWERRWWVPSCRPCHDGMKQQVERQGREAIDDLARRLGMPTMGEAARG